MSKNVSAPKSPAVVFPNDTGTPEYLVTQSLKTGEPVNLDFNGEPGHLPPGWSPVTEGREFQQHLLTLQQKLEQMREEDQLKANFVNAVVHDIRSPLTVILGVLDLIQDDLHSDRTIDHQYYQQLFGDAIQSCQEITNLINDMLELSRMTRNSLLELNLEEVSVVEIVNSAMMVARGIARQARVKLSCKIQANLPTVNLDRKQIHRAVMNLVGNAIKFTPPDGQVTIRASFLNEKRRDALCDYVLISVSDTGDGMSPGESPYVFDAYWQAENGKRKCGTGLGLAIVKRIAVAHGGNVSVRSQLKKGSTFTIMLPVNGLPAEAAK